MERIEAIENSDDIVLMDHFHRYRLASSCAYGTVLDIACGIGYGSGFIANNARVTNYIGVDISPEAIDKAKKNYSSDTCNFHVGTAYDLFFIEDKSIDTIVSMETIEHLDKPELAIKEFRRILKDDGILIGSVPTKSLDEHHDKYYGGNQYHLTRFDIDTICKLLKVYFNFFNIYLSQIRVCIETKPVTKNFDCICPVYIDSISKDNSDIGILLFVASSQTLNETLLGPIFSATSSVFSGSLYFDNIAKIIDLNEKYSKLYDNYIKTTYLYNDLQKFYNDMEEKYIKLYSDHQEILSGGKG